MNGFTPPNEFVIEEKSDAFTFGKGIRGSLSITLACSNYMDNHEINNINVKEYIIEDMKKKMMSQIKVILDNPKYIPEKKKKLDPIVEIFGPNESCAKITTSLDSDYNHFKTTKDQKTFKNITSQVDEEKQTYQEILSIVSTTFENQPNLAIKYKDIVDRIKKAKKKYGKN